MHYPTFAVLPLATAVALALTPQANAADKNPDAEQHSHEQPERITVTGHYTIAKVIDTATGLGLTLQETPQSVSVITKDRIQDQHLDTILDVVNAAVGVSSSQVDNVRNTFQSRGFEISNYQVDGVPLSWSLAGDSGETIIDTALYERIEFVRGATGLLTGAGNPSASINLVRKHATYSDLRGYASAGIGSWNNRQLTADVSNGLNTDGSVRGRLVAKYDEGDTFTDSYHNKTTVLYGALDADLSADTLLQLGLSYQKNQPKGVFWGGLASFYSDGSPTHFDRSTTTTADWTRWQTINKSAFANLIHTFSNGWQWTLNLNQMNYSADTKLLYLSGTVDTSTGALSAYPYRSSGTSKQGSINMQLQGDYRLLGMDNSFVTGLLYSKQDAKADAFAASGYDLLSSDINHWSGSSYPEPDWASSGTVAQDQTTTQKGLYAATRLNLTERFKVIVGGRVSNWRRDGISYGATLDFGDSGVFVPYAGALYDLNPHHRLYASYTEIFQPQNYQDRDGNFLDPLKGKASEIGVKSRFLHDRLHTSVALFDIQQDNLAQTDPGYTVPGSINQAYRAAQGTKSKGFEVEVVGQPVDGWNINAGYTQYRAKDAAGVAVNTDQPTRQFKLFSTYNFSALPQLTVGGGVNWQDRIYYNGTNPVTGASYQLKQGAYALVSLMGRYALTPQLSLQLNVNNLLDKTYYSQVSFFSQYLYGKPRNAQLTLSYRF